jgi:dihydrofolate reductase
MNIIVAVNRDWGIGYRGTQSIVIPEDRRYFKRITDGGTIITGRKTFVDFGRPLPNRKNIVLTSSKDFKADGVVVVHSIDEAIEETACDDPGRVFVIGGESVYNLFLPLCTFAHITKIEVAPPSDTYFPNIDNLPDWEMVSKSPLHEYEAPDGFFPGIVRFSFLQYIRM